MSDLQREMEVMVADLVRALGRVEQAEAELKDAKRALSLLQEVRIPDFMDQAGITAFRTASGYKVDLKEEIRAHISEERREEALSWLEKNNYSDLIKGMIRVTFPRGADGDAGLLREKLRDWGMHFDEKREVHHATLSAFVREKLAEGEEVPMDLLGVRRVRAAKIRV